MAEFTHTPGFPVPDAKTATPSKGKTKPPESAFDAQQRRIKHGLEDSRDRFVKVSFPKEVEDRCEAFVNGSELSNPWPVLSAFADRGLSVSLKRHAEDQYCCTLADGARLAGGKPHLLSGFGPDLASSVFVALFKHQELLEEDWDNAEKVAPPPRKYR